MVLFWIIFSTFLISLLALVGIFTLALKEKLLDKILFFSVALSAGGLMGSAFLHLLPESLEKSKSLNVSIWVLIAFIVFFLIEKILHWRHCHKGKCPVHLFGYLNLLGDGVHNFIDGLVIAAAFLTNSSLGLTTSLAIAMHEIPQEIGDFGVLVYAGFNKWRALFLNLVSATLAIFGGLVGYLLSGFSHSLASFLLPFAAGGFIYIAASDLLPEIRKETKIEKSLISFGTFIVGILIMYALKLMEGD